MSFLHQGIDTDTVEMIGHLPVGKGVLGVPLQVIRALRLSDLSAHQAATGFPSNHPPMHAFLGVPITIRGKVFGSHYVTHDQPDRTFTDADEVAARVLATAAAVAIDNAQLFERVRASAEWMQASREITTAPLSGTQEPKLPLQLIAERACELADAEQAIVLVPVAPDRSDDELETLVVSAAVGIHAEEVLGRRCGPMSRSSTYAFPTALGSNCAAICSPACLI